MLVPPPRDSAASAARFLRGAVAVWLLSSWAAGALAADAAQPRFDHLTTGFELVGQHRDLPCESCHNNAVFKGTPTDCAACHGLGIHGVRATAKPVSHIMSSNRCGACHTPVAWNPAVNFDHAEVIGSCSSCHNGVQAQGKGPGHIDTSLECDACHTTMSWAGAVFNHVGIVTGCAACHNGVASKGMPPTHIPVAAAPCEACHIPTQYTSFGGASMNHPAVSPPMPCANCHEAGLSFFGVTMVTRPPAPHPASQDCGVCHLSTTSFKTGTLQPVGHIPTTQPCTLCHSNPNDYSVYLMRHDGIASGCATCHAAGLSFTNLAAPALVEPPANHVASGAAPCESCHAGSNFSIGGFAFPNASGSSAPAMVHAAVAGMSCESCHAQGLTWAGTPSTVVEPSNHIPVGTTACVNCHSPAGFTSFVIQNAVPPMNHSGFTDNCSSCHGAGKTDVGKSPKLTVTVPPNHIPTGAGPCEGCHSNSNFSGFAFTNASGTAPPAMVHSQVGSMTCSSCHEAGMSWIGAPLTVVRPLTKADGSAHVAVGECSACHFNTVSFKGATDLPSNHIPLPAASASTCGSCHANLANFALYTMDHSVVTAEACASCHAAGLSFANMAPPALVQPPANHIAFGAAACESCHSSSTFTTSGFRFTNASGNAPPAMVHAAVPGMACASCHAAGLSFAGTPVTKTLPVNHVPIGTAGCESCHAAGNFTTFMFSNASGIAPPSMIHSAVGGTACSACHEAGKSWIGTPATVLRPALKADGTAHTATGECSTCHFNTTSFKGATDLPSNHFPLPSADNNNCALCHSNANDYSVATMSHVNIASGCATCHATGKNFANMAPPTLVVPPSNHIAFGTAACEACHAASNFTSFSFNNASGSAPPAMVHAAVTGTACASCHAAGLSFVGTPVTKVLPSTHVPIGTATCESCHTATNFSNFAFTNASGTAPPAMVHSLVASTACSTCHEAGNGWIGTPATLLRPATKADGTAHVAAGECSTCHFNTTSFKGATDLPSNHIPLPSSDNNNCALCHSKPNDYSVATMSHANITSNCAQCHAAGKSFANMAPPTLVQPPANHVSFGTSACETCHSNSSFATGGFKFSNASGSAPPAMVHAAVAGMACATCHASGLTFAGVPATKTLPVTHVPVGAGPCESCHTATNFTNFVFTNASGAAPPAMVHAIVAATACSACHEAGHSWIGAPATVLRPAVKADGTAHVATGECSTCHFNTTSFKGATDLPSNHIPLPSADNNNCALCHTNTGNYTLSTMNHVNIGNGCAVCHAAGKSFANMAPPTLAQPPANHLAFGAAACEGCHSSTSFAIGGFRFTNASGTSPPAMVHALVAGAACASCHAAGMSFVGTPATKVLPATHVPVGASACESCHTASNFTSFAFTNVSGTAPPGMVHAQVASTACSTCHEAGNSWIGTPVTLLRPATKADGTAHVAAGECSTCHFNTTSFKGATDLPSNHIPLPGGSASNCATCHSNLANFALYAMNHSVVTAETCATCHASGKSFANMAPPTLVLPPANHIAFGSAGCESCHSSSNFASGGFKFTNASASAPPAMVHAAVSGMACASCHAAGLSFAGTPATRTLPPNHVPIGSGACESCHAPGNFTTFVFTNTSGTAPPAMVHAAVPGAACASCHASGLTFVGAPATRTVPSNHVPVGTVACEGCHAPANFTAFSFSNVSGTAPPAMVHSLVSSTACSSCHEAGRSWVGSPVTVVRPALKADGTAHVAAGECSTCHFNTTSFKGATDLPANHLPLPAADNNNCALCHSNPSNYSLAAMSHANIASGCASCHAAGKSFANMAPPTLVQPPANHVPFGSAACERCHSNTSFAAGGFKFSNASGTAPPAMVHAAVSGMACATCHASGLTFAGTPATRTLPSNHVPIGTAACESCHAPGNFTSFVFTNASATSPPAMVHAAVAGVACATCHAAGKSFVGAPATRTLPSNHVPIGSAACESCHAPANFTSFAFTNASGTAPASMVHGVVTSTPCSSCHEAGKSWAGTPATLVRPALKANGTAHVTGGECSTCHFNTTSFKGATDLPSNHIPLPAADGNNCVLCHTTAGNYTLATMNHVNISSNCAQCHAYGLSFANIAAPTLVQPPSGTTGHIPSNAPNGTATIACEQCHLATVFTTFAGTVMKHAAVRAMTCMSCHEIGMKWKTNTGVRLWVRDSAGHHAGQDCGGSGCHSSRDKFARRAAASSATGQKAGITSAAKPAFSGAAGLVGAAGFNHQRVMGASCISCHGQASGMGKPPTHIHSSDRCESCHMTIAWSPVTRVDHLQLNGTCVSCHDGSAARGKSRDHIASGANCEACHTSNAWSPARFDHAAMPAGTCRSCHDSVHATGKPANHVPTSAQCDACHGTLGWKPALLDHSKLSSSCVSCHDNNIALGMPGNHMNTQRDCATCHSYPDWTPLHFVHTAAAWPGQHKAALECSTCHTSNTEQIPWASPADAGNCAGCHARNFRADRHPKTSAGASYTASELRDCSGACHVYTDATLAHVAKAIPGPYHRVADSAFKH